MSLNFKVAVFVIVVVAWLAHAIWLQNKVLNLEAMFNKSQEINKKEMNFTHDWIRSLRRTMPESTLDEIKQLQLQVQSLQQQLKK